MPKKPQSDKHKKTIKKNAKKNDLLARIIGNLSEEALVIDSDYTIHAVNSAFLKRFNLSRNQVVGHRCFKIYHKRDQPCLKEEYICPVKEVFKIGKSYNIEHIHTDTSGNQFVCDLSTFPIFDSEGNVEYVVELCRDITKQKLAEKKITDVEKKLFDTEQQFQLLFMSTNEGIALHEIIYNKSGKPKDYKILDVNPAYETIVGIKKKDAIGKLASELYGTGEPPYLEIYSKVTSTGQSRTFETTFKPMNKSFKISVFSPSEGKFATLFADISERKAAEEKLKESEEKYKALFERTQHAIYLNDLEGNFLDANDVALNLLGYEKKDIPNLNFRDLLDEEQLELAMENTIKLFETGKFEKPTQYKLKCKDGRYIWVETEGSLVYKDGKPYAIQGMAKDITDKKLVQEALMKSEEKYREMVENINDVIYQIGIDGKLKYVSPAIESKLGYKASEMIGQDFKNFILKDDLLRALNNVKNIFTGKSLGDEYRILTKEGEVRWIHTSSRPIVDNGNIIGLQGVLSDITERKQNEEELRKLSSVVEQSTNSIAILNKKGNVEYANPIFYNTYEVTPKDLIGKNWRTLKFNFSNFKEKSSEIATTVLKKGLVWKGEIFNKDSKGFPIWRQSILFPLKDNNKITHIIYSGEDITERKRAEEELEFRFALERVISKISTNFINLPIMKIDNGISQALAILGKFANVDRSYIFQFNNDISLMSNTYEWCDEGIEPQIDDLRELPTQNFNWSIKQLKMGKIIHIPKVSELPNSARLEKKVFEQGGIQSLILIPMEISRDIIGFIGFDSVKTEKTWSKDIISLMKTIGGMFANTLERKRVEQELRWSEERFRQFFENEPEYCYMVSPDGTLVDVNKAALKALGHNKDELIGKPVTSIYAPEQIEKVKKIFKKWKMKNKLKDEELVIKTKTGERRTVLLSASIVKDTHGKVLHSISVQKDITDQKNAEEALKESEEKFRTLAEQSPNMIFINQNGKIIYANKKCEELMGYKWEEFYDNNFNFMILIAPEYREKIAEAYKWHMEKGKEIKPFEYAIIDKNGNRIEALYFSKLIKYQGDKAILGTIIDITSRKRIEEELRKSEDRYRTISELISDFVYSIKVNPDGTQESEWSTETLQKILGLDHDELLKQGGWQNVIYPADLPIVIKRSHNLGAGKSDIAEYRVLDKKGDIHWIRDYGYPIWDKTQGRVVRIYGAAQDITVQKLAEEEIRKSKERFQEIVNLLPEGVFEIDLNGNFIYTNQKGFEISGYSQKDIDKGLNALQMFIPEDQVRVKKNIERILNGEEIGINEYTAIRKDGTTYPALIHSATIKHNDKPVGLRGIIIDITERKAVDEALKKSEEEFRLLFKNASEGIIYLDPEGKIIDINPRALDIAGGKREEFIEKNIIELGSNFGLDEENMWSTFEEVIMGKKNISVEWEITNLKGEKLILLAHPSLINIKGELTGISMIIEDITKRKAAEEALRESEEKFRGIAEGSFDIIFILNLEGEINYISPVVERLLGFNPELLLGKNFKEFIPNSELAKIKKVENELIKGRGFEGLELKICCKDGTLRDFEVNINPIHKHDEIIGFQGIARDITDRKHTEEEMKKQLMKFKLDEGEVYLVKERTQTLSLEAFKDLVKVGYSGLIVSRTPEKHFNSIIDENNEFLWLSEKQNHNSIFPNLEKIEERIENLPHRKVILLDRLDYLIIKYKFRDILTMVQHLKDLAVIHNQIMIISFDPDIINSRELRLLEKETKEIETIYKSKLPEHFFNILKYIYQQNVMGIKPSYTDIGTELEMSKPTVRKRIRELTTTGYLLEYEKGRNKVVELSNRGKNIFLK